MLYKFDGIHNSGYTIKCISKLRKIGGIIDVSIKSFIMIWVVMRMIIATSIGFIMLKFIKNIRITGISVVFLLCFMMYGCGAHTQINKETSVIETSDTDTKDIQETGESSSSNDALRDKSIGAGYFLLDNNGVLLPNSTVLKNKQYKLKCENICNYDLKCVVYCDVDGIFQNNPIYFSLPANSNSIIPLDLTNVVGIKGKNHFIRIYLAYFSDEVVPENEFDCRLPGFLETYYHADLEEENFMEDCTYEEIDSATEIDSIDSSYARIINKENNGNLFDYFLDDEGIEYELNVQKGEYTYYIFSKEKILESGIIKVDKNSKILKDITSLVKNEKYIWITFYNNEDDYIFGGSGIYRIN